MLLHKSNFFKFLKSKLIFKLFNILTRKSLNVFLRSGDIISQGPLIEATYEYPLTKLIDNTAKNGMSDFLIDVGANIGLTSCKNGNKFKKVYCFEPNPLCVNILKTNLSISLINSVSKIFDFALGDNDGKADLYVPKHNWGGAFLRDGNGYSDNVLGSKDGFEQINKENYIINTVKVKNSEVVFKNLFTSISDENLYKGVIKIDVEGFERKVLLAIANTLLPSLNVVIVFENFDPTFDLSEIKNAFKGRSVSCSKLKRSIKSIYKSKLRKYFEFILFGEETTLASIEEEETIVGDIVLMVE